MGHSREQLAQTQKMSKLDFLGGAVGKKLHANEEDMGSISGLGRLRLRGSN